MLRLCIDCGLTVDAGPEWFAAHRKSCALAQAGASKRRDANPGEVVVGEVVGVRTQAEPAEPLKRSPKKPASVTPKVRRKRAVKSTDLLGEFLHGFVKGLKRRG